MCLNQERNVIRQISLPFSIIFWMVGLRTYKYCLKRKFQVKIFTHIQIGRELGRVLVHPPPQPDQTWFFRYLQPSHTWKSTLPEKKVGSHSPKTAQFEAHIWDLHRAAFYRQKMVPLFKRTKYAPAFVEIASVIHQMKDDFMHFYLIPTTCLSRYQVPVLEASNMAHVETAAWRKNTPHFFNKSFHKL